jgi:hypothetical protein
MKDKRHRQASAVGIPSLVAFTLLSAKFAKDRSSKGKLRAMRVKTHLDTEWKLCLNGIGRCSIDSIRLIFCVPNNINVG